MKTKSALLGTALAMALSAGSVQAAEKFDTLGNIPAAVMTSAESAEVRGTAHIISMLGRIGVTVQSATGNSITFAGSGFTPAGDMGVSNDVSTINDLFL